ncbi:MAG: bacillithiol biosynthesis protein BshC [Bacteroidia bacterium]
MSIPLYQAYLKKPLALQKLYAHQWSPPAIAQAIQTRQHYPIFREALVQIFKKQNAPYLPLYPALKEALDDLALPNTYTLTTGQQLGWLTGPLYTLTKPAYLIQLARHLRQTHPTYKFVPIFWMASEDHDAQEVRKIFLSYKESFEYQGNFFGAVGRHLITEKGIPSDLPFLALSKYFAPGTLWKEAFRATFYALFGAYGLVVLDPDDPELKTLALPLWEKELRYGLTLPAWQKTQNLLQSLGYKTRLHARPVNLFALTDTARTYIQSPQQYLPYLEKDPAIFSPNVLLRPVYQEYVLPNLLYLSGPHETAYWLELYEVFKAFEVSFPIVMPRASFICIPAEKIQEIRKLGWEEDILFLFSQSNAHLREILIQRKFENFLRQIEALLQPSPSWLEVRKLIAQKLPESERSLIAQEKVWQRWKENFLNKVLKNLANRHPEIYMPFWRWREAIQPEGYSQERMLNVHALAPQDPFKIIEALLRVPLPEPGTEVWVSY